MSVHAAQPFNALPLLPPQAELETPQALKACIGARAALAELKALGGLIPNPSILINSIPLLEAQASSEIENIVTIGDRLFRFADAPTQSGVDPATKETLRYRTALARAFDTLASHPLSTRTAVEICTTIKGVQMDVRRVPGVALANDRTGEIVYTPPQGETHLRDLLANWERWRSIPSQTATAGPVASSTSCSWSSKACSTSRCSTSAAPSSGARVTTIACCSR
jgi:Fic family protein